MKAKNLERATQLYKRRESVVEILKIVKKGGYSIAIQFPFAGVDRDFHLLMATRISDKIPWAFLLDDPTKANIVNALESEKALCEKELTEFGVEYGRY